MKRNKFKLLFAITSLGSLIWTACQKTDQSVAASVPEQASEKFFNSYAPAKPASVAAQAYASSENRKRPFIDQMIKKAGIPRWDKALLFENVPLPSDAGAGSDKTGTVVHIPMVPEKGNMVAGSLIITMMAGDTTMSLLAASDYAAYGFGAARAGAWNAEDVFTILTKLDNLVFGRTAYRITDGRIMGGQRDTNYKVRIDPPASGPSLTEQFVTLNVCRTQTVCVIGGEPGSGSGVCSTYVHCTTYYLEIPDAENGGGTGGGTGGGPTGGGGTGGTGGGGGIGWVPFEDEGEFDEAAEALILNQVFNSISEPSFKDVTYTSPDQTGVPFEWTVVKNSFNHWEVVSSDIAYGYNSASTGAIVYDIQHVNSQIRGQTSWNRIPKRPGGIIVPLVNLSWTESSYSKAIASDYRSGTITVSGVIRNFGIFFGSYTQSCTINVH